VSYECNNVVVFSFGNFYFYIISGAIRKELFLYSETVLFSCEPNVLHHSYLSSINVGVESVCALGAP